MGNIFISFRRQDAHDMAWRLLDYLNRQGWETVHDMNTFGPGDFRASIRRAVESASAIMVLVGQNWLDEASSDGTRSPGEWVEAEIELALATGTPILPVLVHGSSMPRAECLPKSIREFVFQRAASVRSDEHFADDAERLCTMLDQLAPRRPLSVWWKRLVP